MCRLPVSLKKKEEKKQDLMGEGFLILVKQGLELSAVAVSAAICYC